jgi:hypothetical protein
VEKTSSAGLVPNIRPGCHIARMVQQNSVFSCKILNIRLAVEKTKRAALEAAPLLLNFNLALF